MSLSWPNYLYTYLPIYLPTYLNYQLYPLTNHPTNQSLVYSVLNEFKKAAATEVRRPSFLMKLHLWSVCHSMTQLGHWVIESRGHVWAGDYFLMNNCKRRKKIIFLYNYTEYYCTTKQSTAVQLYRVKLYNCTE